MSKKISVSIVGPGSLGGVLAVALSGAGYAVKEVVYRTDPKRARDIARKAGAKPVKFDDAAFSGEVVWICVADSEISETAKAMSKRANWKGKYVLHASGALSSDELISLKKKGASIASVHPMMSFVRSAPGSFMGVPFALEGDGAAKRVAAVMGKSLGGMPFDLRKKDKPLYHALGAFSSPLLVAHLSAAEKIGKELGLEPEQTRRVIAPILKKTLSNYLEHGPAAAFSGPIVRGDKQTIRSHLEALKSVPAAEDIYRALAQMALRELPVKRKAAIRKLTRSHTA